jgi:hypothetical protein
VRSSGGGVRVTRTPEDTEVVVGRRGTEEGVVRSRSRTSNGRKTVEEVGGGVETLRPETRGQSGLDQKSAHDIVRGANHALGTQRKSPRVVREIINHYKVVLIARHTGNRRRPQTTVNKIKCMRRTRRRRKRKVNMAT